MARRSTMPTLARSSIIWPRPISTTESESRSLRYLRIIYGGESHWNKGAGMGLHGAKDIELRFSRYVDALVGVIGHADRAGPFRDYCTGLMMPGERKSVEPMERSRRRGEPRHSISRCCILSAKELGRTMLF